VPHLSVILGVLLAALSLAVLIFFIHHVATSIRIETVLADLADETRAAIDRLYPDEIGQDRPRRDGLPDRWPFPEELGPRTKTIRLEEGGYLQLIDDDALMRIASEHDLLLRIEARPGCFITEHDPVLLAVAPVRVRDEVADQLQRAFIVGPDRTPAQDLEYSLRLLVEIAQRSLSPGINDPTTALYCIDRLGEALCRLAEREIPSPVRADAQGQSRVWTSASTMESLSFRSLAAVARYATGDADVIRSLLRVIEALSRRVEPGVRDRFLALGEAIERASQNRLSEFDRESLCSSRARPF
jgi:uncharacterized membrane protein